REAAARFLAQRLKSQVDEIIKALEKNKDVFTYLGTEKLPAPANPPREDAKFKAALEDDKINAATRALTERASEEEIGPLVRKVDVEILKKAINGAELQALAFEKASDPTGAKLKALSKVLNGLLGEAAQFHKLALIAQSQASTDSNGGLEKAVQQVV